MKKLMAVILSVVLILSVLPISVFAAARDIDITEHYINDTFVYEFERGDDGKFETFNITIVHVYSDGSTMDEYRTAYSNDSVETNCGTLMCTDTQDETPWIVGNTYQVESNFGTFDVEVKEHPIASIEIDDVNYCTVSEEGRYSYNPTWRVYYADGRCEEMYTNGGINIQYDNYSLWYNIEYTDTQEENLWELGQTYQVTGTVLGISDTFNVTVNTVQDILVDDVVRLQGTGTMQGHWDNENDVYVENSWMEYSVDPNSITVIFTDGTSISGTPWEISEITGYHPWYNSDQSYDNQWEVGTHTATISCFGFEKEYNVVITPSPIKSIDIQDVSIIEGSSGYDNGEFYYYEPNLTATVTFNDGTVENYNGSINIGDVWYNISVNTEIQYEEPWLAGNTYEVTGTLLGASCTFNITITPTPVKSIDIQDVSIIEGSSGYDNGEFYYYNVDNIRATITFNDGTVRNYNGSINIGDEWYNISVNTEIQNEEPWTVGNTCEVTGTLLGVSDTFNVTIIPSPVKSIEIEDLTIMEGTYGRYEGDFYYYDIYSHNCTAKITLTDGTVIDNNYFNFGNEYHHISIDTSSQYEEPWLAGNTYEVTGTLLGASCTFNITITPTPVKSIDIQDVSIIEGFSGYDNGEFYYYNVDNIRATITFNDGTVRNYNGSINIGDEWYNISVNTEIQNEEPWTVGNTYEVTGTLLGVIDTFNVTITPTPVQSVKFKDIVLRQGIDSYFDGMQDRYIVSCQIDEVVLKNDEPFEIVDGELIYNGEYYLPTSNYNDMQWEEPWQVGNTYTVTGTLLGVSGTFNVTIVENPIREIEILKNPDKTEYVLGEAINLKGLKVRINYKDNTYEDVVIDDDYISGYPYEKFYYSQKLDEIGNISCYQYEDIGEQTVELYIFNKTVEIPITIKENLVEQITLKENADKSLTITVYNSDTTSYEMKVLSLGSARIDENGECSTIIVTDKGGFYCKFFVSDNSFVIALYNSVYYWGSEEFIKSNKISRSEWFEVASKHTFNEIAVRENFINKYNGVITSNNIDDIIELALGFEDMYSNDDSILYYNGDYPVFSANTVKNAVLQHFALEDIDLSLSKYYDPQTNTYEFHPKMLGGGEATKLSPDKISYSNGVWTVITTKGDLSGNYTVETYTLNDEQKILSFEYIEKNVGRTPGDANGDDKINSRDAAIVMQYANGWEVDINLENADVNGDGIINARDYALLIQYTNGWDVSFN